MTIRLVVSDIDGTLVRKDKSLSPNLTSVIGGMFKAAPKDVEVALLLALELLLGLPPVEDEERAEEIVEEMPAEARRETEQLRRYEPDTAGGLMTTEFVSVAARK